MISRTSILGEVRSYTIVTLGLLVYAFGFTTMLVNAGIVCGGASGLSTLCYYGISQKVPVGVYYLIINSFLITIGFLTIGPKFGTKTIYAILFDSVCLSVMQLYIPRDILGMDYEADKLILSILGGLASGLGVSICLSQGGSSGGTDILGMLINKYFNIPIGRAIMMCDSLIVLSSFFVFHTVRDIVYGFVVMGTTAYAIDSFLSGSKQSVQIMIFSKKYEAIGQRIMNEVGRGISYVNGEGGYTKENIKVLLVICRKSEQSHVYRIVKEEDQQAFLTVGNVMGVFGKGFEQLRIRKVN